MGKQISQFAELQTMQMLNKPTSNGRYNSIHRKLNIEHDEPH